MKTKILSFLDEIGIAHREADLAEETFLPGIKIEGGALLIDPVRLKYTGDILHEAGHIAVTPAAERAALSQEVLSGQDPKESPEIAVILWTYLAAKTIDLPLEVVFHADGYRDSSQWLMDQFESGTHIGLPLLTWMGITENPPAGEMPRVVSWLRG